MELARIGAALWLSKLSATTAGKEGSSFEVALDAAKAPKSEATFAAHANGSAYAMRPLPGDGLGLGIVIPEASTESLNNIAKIATRHEDSISRRPPG
jgi:hypothetical protein